MNRFLKWAGIVVGSLVGILVLAIGVVNAVSSSRMGETIEVPSEAVVLPEGNVERGARLVMIRGCADCHTGTLAGGAMIADPALGTVVAANLTEKAQTYSDADFERSIRHGVSPEGRPLMVMPSEEYYTLGDQDLADIIAYVRSLPLVEHDMETTNLKLVGRLLFLTGTLPLLPATAIDQAAPHPPAPAPGPTAEYGAYLATGCFGCHGATFSGGPIPGMPPGTPAAQNLTPDPETGLGNWTAADFTKALREGVRPDGSDINPIMPWKLTQHLTDDEIQALWLYLRTVEPKAEGNR